VYPPLSSHLQAIKTIIKIIFFSLFLCGKIEIFGYYYIYIYIYIKVKQSHYRPEAPRRFQEVKVPRIHDNGTG